MKAANLPETSVGPEAYRFPETLRTSPERRGHQRHKTILRVAKLASDKAENLCVIRNVSSGGMMIDVYAVFELGERVAVMLTDEHQVEGKVVWQQTLTIGIQFDEEIDIDDILAKPACLKNGKVPRLPRMEIHCPAKIQIGAKVVKAQACDVSQRGLKLETSDTVAQTDRVLISLPGLRPIYGAVRWQRENQVGIAFHETLPLQELMQWLSKHGNGKNGVGDAPLV